MFAGRFRRRKCNAVERQADESSAVKPSRVNANL
jgi:hypothetical protein